MMTIYMHTFIKQTRLDQMNIIRLKLSNTLMTTARVLSNSTMG